MPDVKFNRNLLGCFGNKTLGQTDSKRDTSSLSCMHLLQRTLNKIEVYAVSAKVFQSEFSCSILCIVVHCKPFKIKQVVYDLLVEQVGGCRKQSWMRFRIISVLSGRLLWKANRVQYTSNVPLPWSRVNPYFPISWMQWIIGTIWNQLRQCGV